MSLKNYITVPFFVMHFASQEGIGCINCSTEVYEKKKKVQIRGLQNSYKSNTECKAVFGSNAALLTAISFHQSMFTNWCLFSVWLVTSPKYFFPLGQDLPVPNKEGFEEVLLWRTNVSNLSNNFMCDSKHDGVIQVEFNVGYICLLSFVVIVIFYCNNKETVKLSQFSQSEIYTQ